MRELNSLFHRILAFPLRNKQNSLIIQWISHIIMRCSDTYISFNTERKIYLFWSDLISFDFGIEYIFLHWSPALIQIYFHTLDFYCHLQTTCWFTCGISNERSLSISVGSSVLSSERLIENGIFMVRILEGTIKEIRYKNHSTLNVRNKCWRLRAILLRTKLKNDNHELKIKYYFELNLPE